MAGFSRDRSRSDGLCLRCKECCRSYFRAYYEAHREELCSYGRAYYEAHREELRTHNRSYDRAYYEAHREELRSYRQKRRTDTQSASREVATRHREPWTPAEDRIVLTADGTALDIAIELGRTAKSVTNRRDRLLRKAVTA